MLFDLRSRGRRRTVQVIYLGLAVLIGGGLILFGVGTGTGGGGLLNGLTGNGSSSGQTQAVDQATKTALKATREHPTDPSAWSQLVQAYYSAAGNGTNYNSATASYTAAGKRELARATQAWQRYTQLTKSPDPTLSILAARAYGQLAQYSQETHAWEDFVSSQPHAAKGYICLAVSSYAAKESRKGDLAAAKALSMVPKLQHLTLKQTFQQAKTNPAVAQQC